MSNFPELVQVLDCGTARENDIRCGLAAALRYATSKDPREMSDALMEVKLIDGKLSRRGRLTEVTTQRSE